MTITATIIADSVSPENIRLTTFQLRYAKFIHGELMTHRVFSRNASSSRAIPVTRLIQDVIDDPVIPVYWGSHQAGMQAGEELESGACIAVWMEARNAAVIQAQRLLNLGLHKQIVNRIIEPWCHINVVVTATDYENFFALRRHEDAQPEMKALADAMFDVMRQSTPNPLRPGEWHLPYVMPHERLNESKDTTIKISVARCARTSYRTHDNKPPQIDADIELYYRLVGSIPLHASPAEHQATPDIRSVSTWHNKEWEMSGEHGNLRGWRQYRKMLPNEFVTG